MSENDFHEHDAAGCLDCDCASAPMNSAPCTCPSSEEHALADLGPECRCRIVGWTRDPAEPHVPAQAEWEQADDCPAHPIFATPDAADASDGLTFDEREAAAATRARAEGVREFGEHVARHWFFANLSNEGRQQIAKSATDYAARIVRGDA